MTPRVRVAATVALVALAAAGAVVAIAARSGGQAAAVSPASKARAGAPPLALDLGVRADPEAQDLRRALGLYEKGQRRQAAVLFGRHDSLEAQIGQAVAAWPSGTVSRLEQLAALQPQRAVVQLNLGLALFWAGRPGAEQALRRAASLEPDTFYAVKADNLLHPRHAPDLPVFAPAEDAPATLEGKSPAEQLAILRHDAAFGGASAKILYGVVLQRLWHPVSALRMFDAAARQAPADPEAQAAAAVGRFDKANPSAAFSRLGPLVKRFPHSATVRFHLGLLLLWIGSVDKGKEELRLATTVEPGSPLAGEAARYLAKLRAAGTGSGTK